MDQMTLKNKLFIYFYLFIYFPFFSVYVTTIHVHHVELEEETISDGLHPFLNTAVQSNNNSVMEALQGNQVH